MKKKILLQKMNEAIKSGNRYNELVVYGFTDGSGEEKWTSLSLGAQNEEHILSDVDKKDMKKLLEKWVKYLTSHTDDNCEGNFSNGKLTVIGFVSGNDGKRVPKRIAEVVRKHWSSLTSEAIRLGVVNGIKEKADESTLHRIS